MAKQRLEGGSKMSGRKYSGYYEELESEVKTRYCAKLNIIGSEVDDPYTLELGGSIDPALMPEIQYPDVYNYLINTPSPYTTEELKAYKSLEGYKYLTAGWVSDVSLHVVVPDKAVLLAKVRHSQAVSKTLICPWIAAKMCGTILCAHCTCMAGLGEACSHIAALLFSAETQVRLFSNTACTSQPCSWLCPTMKDVKYAPISDIDFAKPKTKRRKALENVPNSRATALSPAITTPSPTQCELSEFYESLSKVGKPALLSIIPKYCDEYDYSTKLPLAFSDLFQMDMLNVSYTELVAKCEEEFNSLKITGDQAKAVEILTRDQAKCKIWYEYRAGRITASKFKAAARTDITKPSVSLIKQISYPESTKFSTEATKWGIDHEKTALKAYLSVASGNHQNFEVNDSGLVINPAYPHLGASPDGCVKCTCCGFGVLEIKCPFSCADKTFQDASKTSSFFLEYLSDGSIRLKKSHAYYYQVQAQILLCKADYCDFIVWSKKDLVVLRIKPDNMFIKDVIKDLTLFFIYCVMPELIGKWYTKIVSPPTEASSNPEDSGDPGPSNVKWCYCKGDDIGEMIYCDSESCLIKWFHTSCLKLTKVPKGKWHCPDCHRKKTKNK